VLHDLQSQHVRYAVRDVADARRDAPTVWR
jgi:hypothetical protein